MADRIRHLEEALAVAHAKTSTEVHVLLTKPEDSTADPLSEQGDQSAVQNDVIDAFGTLSIGSDGRSKYHNQSAGADVCTIQFPYAYAYGLFSCFIVLC